MFKQRAHQFLLMHHRTGCDGTPVQLPRALSLARSLGHDSCPCLCMGLENTAHSAAPQCDGARQLRYSEAPDSTQRCCTARVPCRNGGWTTILSVPFFSCHSERAQTTQQNTRAFRCLLSKRDNSEKKRLSRP